MHQRLEQCPGSQPEDGADHRAVFAMPSDFGRITFPDELPTVDEAHDIADEESILARLYTLAGKCCVRRHTPLDGTVRKGLRQRFSLKT